MCEMGTSILVLLLFLASVHGQGPGPGTDEFVGSRDVDDHAFLEVLEEQPIGTSAGRIPTKPGFTYRFSERPRQFELNATTGEITTTVVLDREALRSDRFDLVVLSSQPTYPIEVRLVVVDINDNAPTFPEPSIDVSFSESANPGTRVILDTATDRDVGNNSVTEYRIVGGNEDDRFRLIVVTNPSGETPYLNLETVGHLDREARSFYQLNVSALDGGQPPQLGFLTVNITVLDVNDNPPIFDHSDYVVSLNESVPPGTSVLQVRATDNDLGDNARVTYYLSEIETKFDVDPETGVIVTQESLDCPQNCPPATKCSKSCVFTVFAHDHGSPRQDGRTYVTVNLLDANDNDPHISFRYNPPSAEFGTVDENAQNGTIVAAVSVVDPDDGPSGETTVQIKSGNELGHFRIERNHDVDIIRVNSMLDREKISKYNLTVVAMDKGSPPRSSTSYLIIIVNDINDHEPVFERNDYAASLSELVPIGTYVAGITATDEDTGINSNVYYSIVSGNEQQWFEIDVITGLVVTTKPLDREVRSNFNLKISARDGGPNPRWAYTMLKVEILDENDEIPTFNVSFLNISLAENLPTDSLVAVLVAADNDQGANGTVTYSLSDETEVLYPSVFAVKRDIGRVTTKWSLDRESMSHYTVKVIATDQGQPPQSSTATVELNVIDMNDNTPEFYPLQYFITLPENIAISTSVVLVTAFDPDEGINGEIRFSIVNSNDGPFEIDPDTGVIRTVSKLNRQVKSHYRLTVMARDGGDKKAPENAVVDIVVTDSKQVNHLDFSQPFGYAFSITEDSPGKDGGAHKEIGQIRAITPETKGTIKYSIIAGNREKVFQINENTGLITTAKPIDREVIPDYFLTVLARLGSIYGKTSVNITVLDLNDNPPKFPKPFVTVKMQENWPIGYGVYLARAIDPDVGANSRIVYNLTSNPDDTFTIGRATGMIYLKKIVNYEASKEFNLEVVAMDSGSPPLMSKLSIKIVVEDVNDHTPLFEHLLYETSISELTPVNNRFHALTALDGDSGMNGKVSYNIVEGDSKFGVFPDGYLYVKSVLDREVQDYYELTVIARDHGEKPRSSSATVVIHVLDENDNSPTFNNSTFNFTLAENEAPDTYVGRLLATDKDIGRNAELTFSISTNQNDFIVDPKNGFIRSIRYFDRERLVQMSGQNYFVMEALVTDNGIVRRRDEAKVNIFITDINDNSPQFVRQPYKASVSEGAPLHTQVARVSATDADEGVNGHVLYSITDGNSEGKFKIDEITGQVMLAKSLDREGMARYILTIVARDSGQPKPLSSSATMTIDVMDENDSPPEFILPQTQASILENAPTGTELARFRAHDNDLGINGEVTFSIGGGNMQETFRIDTITGILFLEKPLDYESQAIYHLNITASDGGTPRLTSTTAFLVTVLDVNDNPPSLARTPTTRKIREGLAINTPIMNVSAEDPDSGINKKVMYSILKQEPEGDHFAIRAETGILYTVREIDREYSPTFKLTILATDQAIPEETRLSSEKVVTIFVEDINDNAPVFVSINTAVVLGTGEKGHVVMNILALDADANENGQVTYELIRNDQDIFSVDRSSGNLYLNKHLDPAQIIYNLSVRAVDGASPSRRKYSETEIVIVHLTGDKEGIVFSQSEYEGVVGENETVGLKVITVSANNPHNQHSDLLYFITGISFNGAPQHRMFAIDHKTGVLSTAAVLDRDRGVTSYTVEILAIDKATTPPHRGKVKVHITVQDKNDSPPSFQNVSHAYTVSEDASVGHSVVRLTAIDPDTTGSVTYSLVGGDDGKFSLDDRTGLLTLRGFLDRETKASYRLLVRASDGVQATDVAVHVNVLDANDNPPLFFRTAYSFDIPEDAPRGSHVGVVAASDADEGINAQVSYSVISDWGNNIFSLNPESGVFTLTSRLDYEQIQYYIFVIQAQDSGQPSLTSTVTVYFNVMDLNDNAPLFDPMSYSDEVYENVTVGTSVISVSATDQDSGDNGRIAYSIEAGDDNHQFTISRNGTIYTTKPLDREVQSFYNLIVKASDQAPQQDKRLSSTVQVNIILRDVNDNAPQFVTPNVTSVVENIPPNTVVMAVKALDRDEGRNSYVEYALSPGQDGKFLLGPVDGLLRVNGALDRETHSNYTLTIIARDRGHPPFSASVEIMVQILDENDNSPTFEPRQYSASVAENASVGLSVVQVSASDRDEGPNGRIRYSIVAGDKNHDFAIAEDSGVLRIAKELDHETRGAYVLTVQAEDGGGSEVRHDTATVTIAVTDVNDNPPVFVDSPYVVYMMEGVEAVPAVVATVTAQDFDTTPNSQVRYFMKDGDHGLFQINGTSGEITVSRALDRETEPNYELTVIAMDSGSPRLTGTGTIRVIVQDINDNDPKFEKSNYVATVMENLPPNTFVSKVTAKDADVGVNAKIRYSLKNDLYNKFKINPTSGQIYTKSKLDREEHHQYDLQVIASDSSPTEPRHTITNLTVSIGDENDNAPRFEKDTYITYIPDPTTAGQFVFGATAMDADVGANGRLTYHLGGPEADKFQINPDTGVIRAAAQLSNQNSIYNLQVQALDGGEVPMTATIGIEIRLRPHKNFPNFQASETNFVIPETTANKVLTTLKAASPKSGSTGTISYYIAGGNIGEVFSIDRHSGELLVGNGLDYETIPRYELWVEARDADDPPMSMVLQLSINVSDVNDNTPIFDKLSYNASVMEEEYPPQPLITVHATDLDSGKNGQFLYQLRPEGNIDNAFMVDSHTGQILTNARLDREEFAMYTLTVEAVDQGTPPNTGTATITVSLLDKNDNPPRFTRLFSANVTENSEVGTFVIQVTSSDRDIGPNANAVYSFTENPGLKFKIDPISGNVTVAGPIDREATDEYILKVSAVDGSWRAETPLTITIQDINDNAPEFKQSTYVFNFPEKQRAVTFVGRVTAVDKDKQGPNSFISYSFRQPSDFFEIDPATGDILSKRALQYKHGIKGLSPENQFNLLLVATDHGKPPMSRECMVVINVVDANNHSPVFTQTEYFSPVPARADIGLSVLRVLAVDKEEFDASAEVEYSKVGGNGSDLFDVNKNTGWITVSGALNTSKGKWYTLIIQATDKDIPPQKAEATIKLVITGENQFSPTFSSSSYQVIVSENEAKNSQILAVTALDEDVGVNGQIIYSITSGNELGYFAINNYSGEVSINKSLDYEKIQEYRLNITAQDMGFHKKKAVTVLIVVVTDVNDNAPTFNQSNYDAFVTENSPSNISIFKLTATDIDSGRNAAIQYSIIGGDGKDLFGIDPQTGVITTKASFDYEEKNQYMLEVLASNPDSVQYTPAKVKIHVIGKNEFYPRFVQPSFQFTVSESATVSTNVGMVVATDQDEGPDGEIFYLLVGSSNDKGFSINFRTGMIYVSRSLDREFQSRVVLTVMAKNQGPIRGNDTDEAQVVIMIQDGNDPPVFSRHTYEVNIPENIGIGDKVLTVSAADRDMRPGNNQFVYSIISGNIGKAFRVDPQSGVIETATNLDRETIPLYNLTMGAIDNGSPPQTGTALVKVYIDDINDNGPVIEPDNRIGYVPENEPPGTSVMVLKATDPDLPSNGAPFVYSIIGGEHRKFFIIDENSGLVKTTQTLDREKTPQLNFIVEIQDSGTPQMKSSFTITVIVQDKNDSPSSTRNATVLVNAIEGVIYTSKIANVHPLDPDTTNQFQCEISSTKENALFSIPGSCNLVASKIENGKTHVLRVTGSDGTHGKVSSTFNIHFTTFSNKTVENGVVIRILNMTSSDFIISYYKSFLKVLGQSLESSGNKGKLFGITSVGNHVDLYVAALKDGETFIANTEFLKILAETKSEFQTIIPTTEIIIGYKACQESPCENEGQCDDSIVMYNTLSVVDTPAFIFTAPTVQYEFTCKCKKGFTGQRCNMRLDPCMPNPCKHGGTCSRQGQGYKCICMPTHQGQHCEEDRISVCSGNPCFNGGSCQEAVDGTAYCICKTGFRGPVCEMIADSCRPNPCENGGTCLSLKPGYNCTCHESFFGPHCEHSTFSFGELSYMAFPPLDPNTNDVTIVFSTFKLSGLLLYSYGIQNTGKSDFIAVEIVSGRVKFSSGGSRSATTSITVIKTIEYGRWYKVTATRNGKVMSLLLTECSENGEVCHECHPGNTDCYSEDTGEAGTLNFNNELLYLGGIRSAEAIVERPGQVASDDFVGCIQGVMLNGRPLDLNRPLASKGITSTCPRPKNICSNDVCGVDGTCINQVYKHTCICKNGLMALDCSQALESFSFTEGTFVEYEITEQHRRRQLLPHIYHKGGPRKRQIISTAIEKSMSLQFRTMSSSGILLYCATREDFTLLQIKDGILIYTSKSEFQSPVNVSVSSSSLNDGEWHNVSLIRRATALYISVGDDKIEINATKVHDFLDPSLTKLFIGGLTDDFPGNNEVLLGFNGCISTFIVNGEVQPLNGTGNIFRALIHGKLRSGCIGTVQNQGAVATDPLSVGVTLVIIFFVVLMVAILVSFIVYRRRRQKREKGGSGSTHHKQNGAALLATTTTDTTRGHQDSGYIEGGEMADDSLRSHLVTHELATKKHKEREVTERPQRPDIIEREVMNKSPAMPSLRMEDNSLMGDNRNMSTLGELQDSEAPEHYDLENASSIAPSDIDIVYHYKGYRDGNVRKYKTNPHIPNFHKHNHRHSPHQYHGGPGSVSGPLGARNSPRNVLRQSPTAVQHRESPSVLKMQSTPLARLSPSSELSQQTPRILTLQDISGRPLQTALLATSQAAGVKDPMTNSERSLNSPVSQLSHSTGSIQSNPQPVNPKDKKVGGVTIGLTAEEIDRLNSRPRNSSLVSTLDAVSSSSEDHHTKDKLAELLETNTELLEAADSSTDESGNDSFTCSEFEYENNYDRVAREFGPGNMIFSKLAEVENENDEDSAKNFDGFDSFHGSLSTLVASDDDLSNMSSYKPPNGSHLGWDYLLNWGPNFESLVGVFKDIAELPDTNNPKPNAKPGEEYV